MKITERCKIEAGIESAQHSQILRSDWVTRYLTMGYTNRVKVFAYLVPVEVWTKKRLKPNSTRQRLLWSIDCGTLLLREAWRQKACSWGWGEYQDGWLWLQQQIHLWQKAGYLQWQYKCVGGKSQRNFFVVWWGLVHRNDNHVSLGAPLGVYCSFELYSLCSRTFWLLWNDL